MLLAVVGATGTGKSAFALGVADWLGARGVAAEVVNSDAMQLYRGMDVATAKLTIDEQRGVPHHLLDVLNPDEDASVAAYQRDARDIIAGIEDRGAVAVLVGGSGLYCSSVLFDLEFPATDHVARAELEATLERDGVAPLLAELRERDPAAAARVDAMNPRRVIRALEVTRLGLRPRDDALAEGAALRPNSSIVHLATERADLVPRLDERAADMWRGGIVDETRALIDAGIERGTTARRAIGTAQAIGLIRGALTEDAAIAETQSLTRRFARRQVSWFRRYPTPPEYGRDVERVAAGLLPSV